MEMKYLEVRSAMDWLRRYYPRYYSNELIILMDDILQWLDGELAEDGSTLIYLKSLYKSPAEAVQAIWNEIQLLAGTYWRN